jgi:hypothetical protein
MKTKKFLSALVAVVALTVILIGCSKIQDNPVKNPALTQKSAPINSLTGNNNDFTSVLTDEVKASLLYMLEEEKLARDVYNTFYDQYKNTVFSNIEDSEVRHVAAVQRLVDGYGLTEDPEIIEFFQDLKTGFIAQGSVSLEEALNVGIIIEEQDIDDLTNYLDLQLPSNIKQVYTNLLAASENHLAAFTLNLSILQ